MRRSSQTGSLGIMSEAVRDALLRHNRSQAWLAKQVGVSAPYLSKVLTGSAAGSMALWDDMLRAVGLRLVVERDERT